MEQDGPEDAKTGDNGVKFRMSERQRVRGTAVDSWFCEARGNLVSNTVTATALKPFPYITLLAFLWLFSVTLRSVSLYKNRKFAYLS